MTPCVKQLGDSQEPSGMPGQLLSSVGPGHFISLPSPASWALGSVPARCEKGLDILARLLMSPAAWLVLTP